MAHEFLLHNVSKKCYHLGSEWRKSASTDPLLPSKFLLVNSFTKSVLIISCTFFTVSFLVWPWPAYQSRRDEMGPHTFTEVFLSEFDAFSTICLVTLLYWIPFSSPMLFSLWALLESIPFFFFWVVEVLKIKYLKLSGATEVLCSFTSWVVSDLF